MEIVITIGPSSDWTPNGKPAVDWHAQDSEGESIGSGGWMGPGPGSLTPWGWMRYARRHLARQIGRRGSRIRWVRAEPAGYSEGGGHAPQGVRIHAVLS